MGDTDDIFLKRFSAIIAALVGVTFVILFIAGRAVIETDEELNPSRIALANDRTQPVGAVRTEVTAEDVAAAAQPPAADAQMASMSGAEVYSAVCGVCHDAGVAGAPVPGSDLWAERAQKGLEELAYNAINGINAMPAKGGRMDLSDEEVTAAVEHMLAQ